MTTARHKETGWLTRERGQAIAFLAIAGAVVWLCWMVAHPVVGPITWGLALAGEQGVRDVLLNLLADLDLTLALSGNASIKQLDASTLHREV